MVFVKQVCSLFQTLCVTTLVIAEVTVDITDSTKNIPLRCQPYISYFLDSSNPSREMAQTEQESSCDPLAESPFAKGLRQFTDQTGEWMSLTHCKHLGDYDPFNPEWSIKCGLVYMELLESNNKFGDYCFNRFVAEAEYNGGAWVIWELDEVGNTSLSAARAVCGKDKLKNGRRRAEWACEENYDYPKHISRRQSKYFSLGGTICK